jgi:glycosyltransferase involved in cell wall biosynthesis
MVLPVHNGADYLEGAIQSVLAQSFTDFELICVDDASTDASPALLAAAAAADPRVHILRQDKNIGLPAALNAGFRAARGEYFSWTSDDNLLRPNMLAVLVGVLDANPDCGVAHSVFTVIDPEGQVLETVHPKPVSELLMGNQVGASFLYRRAVDHALGGYDSSLFGAEDYDFWLRASAHFRFIQVPDDLYLYRKHPRSLTNSRAASIQALTTEVVLRAMSNAEPRARRVAVLLDQYQRNYFRLRFDLLARALAIAPFDTLARMPAIGWHGLRVVRQRWRRKM